MNNPRPQNVDGKPFPFISLPVLWFAIFLPFWVATGRGFISFFVLGALSFVPSIIVLSWRHRLRFSLRTLVLFFLVASIGLGWLGNNAHKAMELRGKQEAARQVANEVRSEAARIENAGGKIIWRQSLEEAPGWLHERYGRPGDPGVSYIDGVVMPPYRSSNPDADLKRLVESIHVTIRELDLTNSGITDAGLEHLSGLAGLQALRLDNTEVTSAGAAKLKRSLPNLEITPSPEQFAAIASLKALGGKVRQLSEPRYDFVYRRSDAKRRGHIVDLSGADVTDADLLHFRRLAHPKYWMTISLANQPITDAGMQHLKELAGLATLDLSGTQVSDAGLKRLMEESDLQALYQGRTKITDDGLEHVKCGRSLTHLFLDDTPTSDEGLQHLEALSGLLSLSLRGTLITDAGLRRLAQLPGLRWLYLDRTQVTDVGLEQLNGLPLQTLCVDSTQVTDAGLVYLKGLGYLTRLSLNGTGISDSGLRHLAGLENIETLHLERTEVTDAGLEPVAKLSKLKKLYLNNTKITDDGLAHIGNLTDLQYLYLDGTQITAEGLNHLKSLPSLFWLSARRTQVTDTGLEHVSGPTSLRVLDLGGTRVTEAGVKKLYRGLPRCEILTDFSR